MRGARFNLSEWALNNRPLVLFFILVFAVAGVVAYQRLGQSEDPPFTFKVMVVKTNWPGATAHEVEQQVTDRVERKLAEVPNVDWVRSYSKPGESLVFFALEDSAPPSAAPETFYQVRKKIGDIRTRLPQGVQGPFFNDEFGDTYTNIYALTGDGFGYRDLKDFGDKARAELLRVPGVVKVDFFGEQEEKIFIELSNGKLATLGVEPAQIIDTLARQNAVGASGVFDTATDRIYVRSTGAFDDVDAIRELSIRANNRVFRLGDIAKVTRGYVDPPQQKMRFQGKEALGIGVTMAKGGDVIELGDELARATARIANADASVQWGMTANVGVAGAGNGSAALLPLTSIHHRDGKPAVWRYDPVTQKVDLAPVAIGQYREDGVVITAGVGNGDWVVAAGVHKLVPGQVVKPYDAGKGAAPAAARNPGSLARS